MTEVTAPVEPPPGSFVMNDPTDSTSPAGADPAREEASTEPRNDGAGTARAAGPVPTSGSVAPRVAPVPAPRPRRILLGVALGASLLLGWGSERALEDSGIEEPTFALLPYRPPLLSLPGAREEIAHLEEQQARGRDTYRFWCSLAAAQVSLAEETGDPGHFRRAEISARRALAKASTGADEARLILLRIGEARHEFARVLPEVDDLLSKRPQDVDALAIRARILLATGRLSEARTSAERLVALTHEAGPRILLARILTQEGRYLEASQHLRQVIRLEKTGDHAPSAWARAHLADVYASRGAVAAPEGLLREATRVAPAAGELHRRFATALVRGSHPPPEAARAAGHQPDAARSTDSIAFLAPVAPDSSPASSEALAGARDALLTAWRLTHDPRVLLDLSRLRRAAGHDASARALLTRAETELRASLTGASTAHLRDLGQVLLERGDGPALQEARQLLARELTVRRDAETTRLAAEVDARLSAAGAAAR